jgi:hypothetical protein
MKWTEFCVAKRREKRSHNDDIFYSDIEKSSWKSSVADKETEIIASLDFDPFLSLDGPQLAAKS